MYADQKKGQILQFGVVVIFLLRVLIQVALVCDDSQENNTLDLKRQIPISYRFWNLAGGCYHSRSLVLLFHLALFFSSLQPQQPAKWHMHHLLATKPQAPIKKADKDEWGAILSPLLISSILSPPESNTSGL